MTLSNYNAAMSPFFEQWKAAITPEMKLQAIDLGKLIANTLPTFWRAIALAILAVLRATITVPKTNLPV